MEKITNCKTALNISINRYTNEIEASINPYLGCSHRCNYCYVQAEKYSKEKNIDEVEIKINIIDVLIKQLNNLLPKYPSGIVYLGTSSDPFQPVERKYKLSHKILSLLLEHTPYNIHIFTKSVLILDELKLIKKFKERVNISITIITTDEKIKNIFEPYSSSIEERLYCMKEFNSNNISYGCSIMPILPYITDSKENIEKLFSVLKDALCCYVWWGYLTLRENITQINKISQKEKYFAILSQHFPELIEKYKILYKNRISPSLEYQKIVDTRLKIYAKKYKISFCGPKWTKQVYQQLF
jgi:DNA repair photolyase